MQRPLLPFTYKNFDNLCLFEFVRGMKLVFVLLVLVTIGVVIGALLQLMILQKLEVRSGGATWANDKDADSLRFGFVKPEIISWSPRIIVYHNFLSMKECDYLKAIALPHLEASTVIDEDTGKGIESEARTSTGMFISVEERKYRIIQAIEKRISVFAQVPVENGELMQVLRYERNQFYRPHFDFFTDNYSMVNGGQRVATFLMYLSGSILGGETYFPWAGEGNCDCGGRVLNGLSVKPVKGDAILFWSLGLDGHLDQRSLHGSCDVIEGEKWSATKWLRERITE